MTGPSNDFYEKWHADHPADNRAALKKDIKAYEHASESARLKAMTRM